MPEMPEPQPQDEHNALLLAHTRPSHWKNPEPASRYNLVVIGAGTAGLVTAAAAATLGARVALVEHHLQKGSDTILGATIVARHAGEMIGELALAMTAGIGLRTIAEVIHPYPTQAEAIRKAADAYNRARLTPFVKKLFRHWLAWTR